MTGGGVIHRDVDVDLDLDGDRRTTWSSWRKAQSTLSGIPLRTRSDFQILIDSTDAALPHHGDVPTVPLEGRYRSAYPAVIRREEGPVDRPWSVTPYPVAVVGFGAESVDGGGAALGTRERCTRVLRVRAEVEPGSRPGGHRREGIILELEHVSAGRDAPVFRLPAKGTQVEHEPRRHAVDEGEREAKWDLGQHRCRERRRRRTYYFASATSEGRRAAQTSMLKILQVAMTTK